jgi:hypothetical protein
MSAPGRSQALIPQRASAEGSRVSAPGPSQALIPQRASAEGSPVSGQRKDAT